MKILVPTDFSDNAENALGFAIAIVNRLGGSITLYHVYKVGSSAAETFKSKLGEIIQEDKRKALQEVYDANIDKLEQGSMDIALARGDSINLIVDRAATNKYNLICLGSTGESDLPDFLFGSTTLGVVRHAKTPILAVPKEAKPHPLENIVLAVDGEGIDQPHLLDNLVALAKSRDARVLIYHHAEEDSSNELHPSIAKALHGVDYEYHVLVPETDDISESIKAFVNEQKADLLCLIRRKRGFISRMFKENVTHDALFDIHIPLLIFKD